MHIRKTTEADLVRLAIDHFSRVLEESGRDLSLQLIKNHLFSCRGRTGVVFGKSFWRKPEEISKWNFVARIIARTRRARVNHAMKIFQETIWNKIQNLLLEDVSDVCTLRNLRQVLSSPEKVLLVSANPPREYEGQELEMIEIPQEYSKSRVLAEAFV